MSLERDNVIRKIRLLVERSSTTTGGSEAEALSAAAKIGELLTAYNIELDQVFLDAQKCVELKLEASQKTNGPAYVSRYIAELCDCRVWRETVYRSAGNGHRYKRTVIYHYFGLPVDIELVNYLWNVIDRALKAELAAFKTTDLYRQSYSAARATRSFQRGFLSRIGDKIKEQTKLKAKAEETVAKPIIVALPDGSQNNTSIIALRNSKVEREFASFYPNLKLRTVYSYSRANLSTSAWNAGHTAGDKVNLNRPIGGSTNRPVALLG